MAEAEAVVNYIYKPWARRLGFALWAIDGQVWLTGSNHSPYGSRRDPYMVAPLIPVETKKKQRSVKLIEKSICHMIARWAREVEHG